MLASSTPAPLPTSAVVTSATTNHSEWLLAYLPNMFRKPAARGGNSSSSSSDDSSEDEEEEPLDLSDEELDASEAFDLMLGLPKELCLISPSSPTSNSGHGAKNSSSPPSPPPKAAEPPVRIATSGCVGAALNNKSLRGGLPPSSWRPLPTAPPSPPTPTPTVAVKRPPVVLTYEDSMLVMDASCRKLKPVSRKLRRPIHQTLLIHRTISLVKELRKVPQRSPTTRASSSSSTSTSSYNKEVAKPPPAICRES